MSLLFIGHPKETHLALFAGGELGPLARWRIERHLQQCSGCQDAVADFFHLQSEVSALAETPAVDWNALKHNIAVRVRLEAPPVRESAGWFAHPRIWQIGLATATLLCTMVVVQQLPTVRESAKEAVPPAVAQTRVFEEARGPEADSARANQPRQGVAAAEQPRTPAPASQFAQAVDEVSSPDTPDRESKETAAGTVEPSNRDTPALRDRRDEGFAADSVAERVAPPDVEAERPPATEPVAVTAANLAATSSSPGAFTPPPAAPAPSTEADADLSRGRAAVIGASRNALGGAGFRQAAEAGEQAKTERAESAKAQAAAPPLALLARRAALEKKADADSVWAPERGFTVLPAALEDPAVDVGVAADGWISIRAVDANSGTITITDVYVP